MQVDGASSSVAFSSGSSIAASLSRGVRLDVMPYAEQDLQDEQASANVLALIQAEMATLPQRDYLASLNLPASDQLFASRPRLQQELARVAAKQPLQAIDMSRYEFPAMDAKSKSDPAAWKACIDQARMLIEYQHTRLLNLDLLAKHGPAAWRLNAEIVAHLHTQLTNLLNEAQDEIQEVNRERKDQQTKLYNKLYELESTWYSLVGKNMQLEQECSRLQTELARREEETEQQ